MRADQLLVQQGLAPSRSAAQRLIERGAVRWLGPRGWQVPRKAGDELPAGCEIEVTDDAELRWASRGGLKLEGALRDAGLDLNGTLALDVGQSTGGFTDVLLHAGCRQVVGVDVGRAQLLPRLRQDPRVTALEGINARELGPATFGAAWPEGGFGLITGDLSFISLTLVLPALAPLLAPGGTLLMLVKPQFELQPATSARADWSRTRPPTPGWRPGCARPAPPAAWPSPPGATAPSPAAMATANFSFRRNVPEPWNPRR